MVRGSHCFAEAYGLGGLHNRAGREGGLMAAGPALIALEPPAIDQTMLVTLATRTAEPIGPAGLLQGSLTLLLDSVKPLKLIQGEAFLELDGAAQHDQTGICIRLYAPRRHPRSELGNQEII